MKTIIGYNGDRYPLTRNIVKKIKDFNYINIENHIEDIKGYKDIFIGDLPDNILKIDFSRYNKNITLLHLFNFINIGTIPFISTFETIIPRYFVENIDNKNILINHLADNKCRGIIALSDCTYRIEKKYLMNTYNEIICNKILKKLFVLHPPQEIYKSNIKDNSIIKFIIIGNEFFRKGGFEVLTVLKKLRKIYKNFELYIISNFNLVTRWNVSKTTKEEFDKSLNFINSTPWIKSFKNISQREVFKILQKCHVGLLPTYQETYGYSVLEMQSCGIPVISSNVRALPEINDDSCGWIINFPHGWELGQNTDIDTTNKYKKINLENLQIIISSILENPEQINKKGYSAIERIKKFHDPNSYAEKLKTIYNLNTSN